MSELSTPHTNQVRLTFYPLEFIRATYDRENRELPAIDPRRPITGYVEHAANNPGGIHGYEHSNRCMCASPNPKAYSQ